MLDPIRRETLDPGLVGRDAEVAKTRAFLSAASGAPAALTITGDPGIGKTTAWRHVLYTVGQSSRVLSCQPASAERPLAFSALDDLFGDVAGEVLPALAGPRRHAVETALLHGPPPDTQSAGLTQAGEGLRDPATLRRMVGVEAVDPGQRPARPGELTLAREDLAAGLDGYRRLGIDDLIIGLRPVTVRSIDRLVEALTLGGG